MNRGRKIKHSLSIKNEENISNSPKNETTAAASKHKLLTPCRRVGLNRKRKNVSGSPSEINISSPNNSLTEMDISAITSDANKTNLETPVLKKNMKPKKNSLGARKRINQTPITSNNDALSSEETLKKYKHLYNIISDVCVVLTRCDFDKHILSRSNVRESSVDISMRIENEAISSTPVEANNSEIQTNQISTTVEEDATPAENNKLNQISVTEKNIEVTESKEKNVKVTEINVEVAEKNENATNKSVTSKKFKDLFGDNSDDSDFQSNFKQKKRKRFSLKTKTNKRDTSINEDTNDDSTQNTLEGTDTELPKNKTEKNRIDESFDKKRKSTKSNDDSTQNSQNSLEGTDAELSKNRAENKKTKSNKDTTLKEHDQVILTPKTKPSKEDKIHKRVIDSQIDSDETPELNVGKSRKKRKRSSSHNKKSPKINRKPRLYNSDSDDDFMEKPRREKKDPDIKKKINIPPPDPLNRIEHIRIRENKSYTIMHMNNISSYIKYYDNDVKRTESDDNQQTASQPAASNAQTSMILERKDYLNKGSQEINHNSETSSAENPANENSERANVVSDCNENSETTDAENPETTNVISDNMTEFSNDVVSDNIENVETTDVVSDSFRGFSNNAERIENSETTNVNMTEFSNDVVSNNIENSESTNVISDGFAGFSNSIESPRSAEIHHFRGNIFSNDIENSNSNDIENSNFDDIENSHFNVIETSNFNAIENPSTIEKPDSNDATEKQLPETVDGFEKGETVSDVENPDDPQSEMKRMLKLKSNLINQIKMKRDKLDSLKRIMAYKEEHNLDDLTKTTLQFKYTLREALVELLSHLKTHTERNFNMLLLLGFLKIPSEMVGYNDETKSFE